MSLNNGALSLNQHDEIDNEVSSEEYRLADQLHENMEALANLVNGSYGHTEVSSVNIKKSARGIFAQVSYKRSMYLRTS